MKEKRKFKRFYFEGKIEVKAEDGNKTHIFSANLGNIGLGGIRILSQEKIEINKDVKIEITTPLLDRPLRGKGKVKYIHAVKMHGSDFFAIGIQFTHINDKQVIHLIDKSFGWKKKELITQQSRRELALLLKMLLIVVPIVWILLMVAESYSGYGGAGQKVKQAGEELFRAVDYFLARRR